MNRYTVERNIRFESCGRFNSEEEAIQAAKEQYKKLFGANDIAGCVTGKSFTSIYEDEWKVTNVKHILTHDEFIEKLINMGCKEIFDNHYYSDKLKRFYFVMSQKAYTWSTDDLDVDTIKFEEY